MEFHSKNEYEFFTLSDCNLSDLQKSARLMQTVWGACEFSSLEYLTWQYSFNPLGNYIACFAKAKNSNEIAAQYILIPSEIFLPSKQQTIAALQSVNTTTHPEHQKKGLFKECANQVIKHARNLSYQTIYGFPNNNSLPGFRSLKFIESNEKFIYTSLHSPLKITTNILSIMQNWHAPNLVDTSKELLNCTNTLPEFKEADSIKNNYLHVQKNPLWLKWRYANHPTRKYYFVKTSQGVIIVRVMKIRELSIALVMDIVGQFDENDISIYLDFIRSNTINISCGIFTNSVENIYPHIRQILRLRIPAKLAPRKFTSIFYPINKDLNISNIYFSLGDNDIY